MVMNFYKVEISEDSIAKETYLPALKGSLITDLANYAKEHGFEAKIYSGSLDDIRFQIQKEHPLILLIEQGRGPVHRGHFILVIGYDDKHSVLIVNSGRKENHLISYSTVASQWKRMNYMTLFVLPKSK